MTIKSAEDLLRAAVYETHFIDSFLAERVQSLSRRCESPDLRRAMDRFVDISRDNVDRAEAMLAMLSAPPQTHRSLAIQGLVDQIEEDLDAIAVPSLRDVAIDVGFEAVRAFEVWHYGWVRTWAERLGFGAVGDLVTKCTEAMDDVRGDFEAARRQLAPVGAPA